ncbi:hypothetical protein DIPPA_18719 [Diplonema papillatum]|nr:hypothetical protein DIPPA_18719 [Diplonema papillatum]
MSLRWPEEELPPRRVLSRWPCTRLEKFRTALTDGGIQAPPRPSTGCVAGAGIRMRGRKGGTVAKQPLNRRILQPLSTGNTLPADARWRTLNRDVANGWFHANRRQRCADGTARTSLRPCSSGSNTTSRSSLPQRGASGLADYKTLLLTPTSAAAPAPGVYDPCIDDSLSVRLLPHRAGQPALALAEDARSAASKYKVGKWSPHAITVWGTCREHRVVDSDDDDDRSIPDVKRWR